MGITCFRCGNKSSKTFVVKERGYGSDFDLNVLKISLCDNCIKILGVDEKWFENKFNSKGEYLYEDKIEQLIKNIT
jgi:hypothetical protein